MVYEQAKGVLMELRILEMRICRKRLVKRMVMYSLMLDCGMIL